jgi:uncharacterized membrane protein YkvA (DUF1232 family)
MRFSALKNLARSLKRQTLAAYFAARDPRTPWPVRLLAMSVAAYALSPIDLIPDFIPVLGQLDDLLLVPLGIALVLRLVPAEVMADARERAAVAADRPTSPAMVVAIVGIWLLALCWLGWWAWHALRAR